MRSLPSTLGLASALLVSITTGALAGVPDAGGATDGGPLDPTPAARKASDRSHVAATVGLATPVGEVGAEYTLVTGPHLEIGFGLGLANMIPQGGAGFSPDPQAAVMPRFRHALGRSVITLGAGLSGGHYTTYLSPFASTPGHSIADETNALWANGEAGFELHVRGAFARAYLGYGRVIAHSEVKHGDGEPNMKLSDSSLPYLGLTFGHSL